MLSLNLWLWVFLTGGGLEEHQHPLANPCPRASSPHIQEPGTWEMGKVKGEGPQPGPSAMEQYRQHANLCPSVRKIFKIYYMTHNGKGQEKKICIHSDYLYCLLNARIKRDQTMSEIIKCTNYIIFTKIKNSNNTPTYYIDKIVFVYEWMNGKIPKLLHYKLSQWNLPLKRLL